MSGGCLYCTALILYAIDGVRKCICARKCICLCVCVSVCVCEGWVGHGDGGGHETA